MGDLITEYRYEVTEPGCSPVSGRYGLQVSVSNDISPVFPYLNASLKESRYDHENRILIWRDKEQAIALRPHEIKIAQRGFEVEDAPEIVKGIIERINSVWREHDKIIPCFTEKGRPPVIEIYKLLPKTNCKRCGYQTCLSYAADLRSGKTKPESCIQLQKPEMAENRKKLEDFLLPE